MWLGYYKEKVETVNLLFIFFINKKAVLYSNAQKIEEVSQLKSRFKSHFLTVLWGAKSEKVNYVSSKLVLNFL